MNVVDLAVQCVNGQWHREGLDWRFYKDPDLDD
jgi:hypothetical protein